MAITQVSNSLVKQDLTISGGTVDNTVIGSGTPAAGTFTTVAGTLASTVTGTTAAASDNSTKIATTAYVTTALANLVDSAPGTLNTLNELAAALGDDANFSTTVTNSIAAKANIAAPNFTGNVTFDTTTLTVDASNNRVGIGTASPAGKLQVEDSGVMDINLIGNPPELNLEDSGGTSGQKRARITVNDQKLNIQGLSDDDQSLTQQLIAGDLSNGNIGIGTASPSAGLHVLADVNPVMKVDRGSANTANANWYYNGTLTGQISAANADFQISAAGSSTPMSFYVNGAERMTIGSSGVVEVKTSGVNFKAPLIQPTNADVSSYTGTTPSMHSPASATMAFSMGGAERMRINSSGVAIGTTNTTFVNGIGLKIANATSARLTLADSDNGVGATDGFQFTAAGTAAYVWNQESGFLSLATSATERLHITAAGQVGIGTSGTKGLLHVYEGNSGQGSANGNFDKLVLEDSSHSGMTILGGANTHGAIYFGDPDVNDVGQIKYKHNDDALCLTTNSQERWKIDSGGSIRQGGSINFMNSALTLSKFWVAKSRDILGGTDDHAVYYTESGLHHQFWLGGARRVNIINNGITFGTDTAQANTLDDYEEGVHNVTMTPSSSGSIGLGANDMAYTKVGRLVTCTAYLSVNSASSNRAGYVSITLPFTITNGNQFSASCSLSFNGLASGNSISQAWGIAVNNSNTVRVYEGGSTGAASTWAQAMQAGTDLRITVSFMTT